MITILKLAGVSAMLSAGVVTAYDETRAPDAGPPKVYQDRIAPDVSSRVFADAGSGLTATVMNDASRPAAGDCRAETWPYVSSECLRGDVPGARKAVRTITIERRDAPNTSTLVRVPLAGK